MHFPTRNGCMLLTFNQLSTLQVELATKAVAKDSSGEFKEAISFYCQALEYFVPAIHCKLLSLLKMSLYDYTT